MPDKSQNTEKATPHRLKKAREDGKFPAARDFVGAMQFTAFVAWLGYAGPAWMDQLRIAFRQLFAAAFHTELTRASMLPLVLDIGRRCFYPLGGLAAIMVGITLAMQFFVTGFGISLKGLMPNIGRLNPASKIQQLKRQNLPALVQAACLLPVFGYVVYLIVKAHLVEFYNLPGQSLLASMHVVANALQDLLWKASGAFLVFGIVNLFRQRKEWQGDMKMSKQDIKDENKQNEGSPQIKSRVRRLQREMRRRSMMKDIPKATAVIVNPTHFAVAIRYQMASMSAPTVVAKGKNYLALRIRKIANDHQIPIIENPPLAQALYKSAEIGQEIPGHLFKAVAEVLAYIYRIMKGRLPGQED
jgi:flagellar biosynthetic protein FlhB